MMKEHAMDVAYHSPYPPFLADLSRGPKAGKHERRGRDGLWTV